MYTEHMPDPEGTVTDRPAKGRGIRYETAEYTQEDINRARRAMEDEYQRAVAAKRKPGPSLPIRFLTSVKALIHRP